jgi:hypothetical protein
VGKMKHVLPLTYEPKIKDVINGVCRQTIRPKSKVKPKEIGDLVCFHGWIGKPYRSKWSFRTLYWKIVEVFDISFDKNGFLFDKDNHSFKPVTIEDIAKKDGFKDYFEMLYYFRKQHGEKLYTTMFRVIRW